MYIFEKIDHKFVSAPINLVSIKCPFSNKMFYRVSWIDDIVDIDDLCNKCNETEILKPHIVSLLSKTYESYVFDKLESRFTITGFLSQIFAKFALKIYKFIEKCQYKHTSIYINPIKTSINRIDDCDFSIVSFGTFSYDEALENIEEINRAHIQKLFYDRKYINFLSEIDDSGLSYYQFICKNEFIDGIDERISYSDLFESSGGMGTGILFD